MRYFSPPCLFWSLFLNFKKAMIPSQVAFFSLPIFQRGDVKSILFVTPSLVYDFRDKSTFLLYFLQYECHIIPKLH